MKFRILAAFSGNIAAVCGMFLLFAGCDVIEPAERKQTGGVIIDDTGVVKKVLVEDFTGYRCGHCPKAADVAVELMDTYKDKVVVIAIHSGDTYAKPFGLKYVYDFRTAVGEELFPLFIAGAGQPNGTINRKSFNGTYPVYHTGWAAKVQAALTEKPKMTIKLQPAYDAATQTLTVKTTVKYLQAGTTDQKLALYLTEDSIVYYQKDYRVQSPAPEDVPNYLHRHVLRGAVGDYGAFGKQISAAAIAAGAEFTETFTLSFAGKDWKPEHCAVVGLVNDGATKEVLQAEEVKILGK